MKNLRLERAGWADLILLDVPCSNTGVLARRPEARYRFNEKSLASVAGVQRQIIADSIPLLTDTASHRGSILYATCSLEAEENVAQPAWARKWHGYKGSAERSQEPAGLPGSDAAEYRDGAYSVLLTR
jgi:16S rRNA (cytosine967-C5)-methyltransferase